MCGGKEFDQPRVIKCSIEVDRIVYRARDAWLGGNVALLGRACLGCGFVAMMVDPDRLRKELRKT